MKPWVPRRVGRDEARIASLAAAWVHRALDRVPTDRRADGAAIAPMTVRVIRIGAVAIDPDGAVAVVRGAPEAVLVVGGGGLVRGLAQAVLGGPAELAAARPATVAEQAVWALAVATTLDAAGVPGALTVEPSRIAPAMIAARGGMTLVELAVEGPAPGTAWIAIPAGVLDLPPPRVALAALADRRGWLDQVVIEARVVIAHAALTGEEIAAVGLRDVIVVGAVGAGPGTGSLRVGRGEVPVAIDAGAARVTVRAPYQRGRMDETLGDDLTVELAVSAGTVAVTARKLLELAPGQLLALDRPAGGQVELVVGRRVVGTGELIDVDGELAVRVLAVNPR